MNRKQGFTLLEMVIAVTIIFILTGIGAWRISGMRTEAQQFARNDALAAVQRMQQLADMEGVTVASQDTLLRIQELQEKLAAKGHFYYQLNPINVAAQVVYDETAQEWRVR